MLIFLSWDCVESKITSHVLFVSLMAGDDSCVTQLDVRSEYNENQGFSVVDKYLFVLEDFSWKF